MLVELHKEKAVVDNWLEIVLVGRMRIDMVADFELVVEEEHRRMIAVVAGNYNFVEDKAAVADSDDMGAVGSVEPVGKVDYRNKAVVVEVGKNCFEIEPFPGD